MRLFLIALLLLSPSLVLAEMKVADDGSIVETQPDIVTKPEDAQREIVELQSRIDVMQKRIDELSPLIEQGQAKISARALEAQPAQQVNAEVNP